MVEFVVDTEHPVSIPCREKQLNGLLHVPRLPQRVVIFAHGSGSSRLSPRNQYMARALQQIHIVTLLFDLLTPEEEIVDTKTAEYRFNIPFLAERLVIATEWMLNNPVLHPLPVGYFGASTGGGAALVAASQHKHVRAVVSRGGRPDLADKALAHVSAATLLIVGGDDEAVIQLNRKAYAELHCIKKLEIVPGATHLFEEPGKLEAVASLAKNWFKTYL